MRIATGTDLAPEIRWNDDSGTDARGTDGFGAEPLGFEESVGAGAPVAGCACHDCAARLRRGREAARAARAAASGGSRIHRAVRSTCLATTVLAGAGVVGLTAGAGTAHAAPGQQGWDGSKYWFKNSKGEWRWTAHYGVYADRVGKKAPAAQAPSSTGTASASGSASASASGDSTGLRQGWDGSKYWFKNGRGEWRWTSHRDVYLSRTGQSGAATPAPAGAVEAESGSDGTEAAVQYALAQLGKPYVWGGNGPSGYDCSGLVQQAFRRSGIGLPRVADDQYAATTPIGKGQLRRGDLLFWSDSGRASGIHHVGIYLGGNTFVEAPRPGKTVRVSTISSGFHPTHYGRP